MDVFILGIERSATTWVSNILEAHPKTEVYMEPLSIYTSHFKEWPNRMERIIHQSQYADYFKNEFFSLKKDKRFCLTKVADSNFAWQKDFNLAQLFHSKFRSQKARNFLELNFHRRGEPFSFTKIAPDVKVIKELRLNFNSNLLAEINPNVKVIVVVRDYASNIKSIVKYVREGNLVELRDLLSLRGNEEDYLPLMNYWIESYNNIIEGLEGLGVEYQVISQRNILLNSIREIRKIFNLLSLNIEDQVLEYLEYSNSSGKGAHNTNRDHSTLLKQEKDNRKEVEELLGTKYLKKVHPDIYKLLSV